MTLRTAKETLKAGASLASTIYNEHTTILLMGELGSGKTTVMQGLAAALGITHVTSPTYALEQRYETPQGIMAHMDLYRLTPADAGHLLDHETDEVFLRCIEWADRLTVLPQNAIHLRLEEQSVGRTLTIRFDDIPLPTDADIRTWREETALPPHIIAHCEAVADTAATLADALLLRCEAVRKHAVVQAAKVHDLLRFIDFQDPTETHPVWEPWKRRYAGQTHEAACARFLEERGYEALARIVESHGLTHADETRTTLEQKLLFYADKRVAHEKRVTLRERFEEWGGRYGRTERTEQETIWYHEAEQLERQLFPSGPPL